MADYADDGEVAAFYWDRMRTARKEHQCEECRRTIQPGETYESVTAKWEGDFCEVKTCQHCIQARTWLQVVCGGWIHGTIREDLNEHLHDQEGHDTPWLRLAVEGMRSKWEGMDPLTDFGGGDVKQQ